MEIATDSPAVGRVTPCAPSWQTRTRPFAASGGQRTARPTFRHLDCGDMSPSYKARTCPRTPNFPSAVVVNPNASVYIGGRLQRPAGSGLPALPKS